MFMLSFLNLPASIPLLFANAVFQTEILLPLVLVILDVVTGVLSANKRGVFAWSKLADYLGNDIVKYIGCIFLLFFALVFQSSVVAETLFATFGMATLGASITASIYSNIRELFPAPLIPVVDQVASDIGLPPDPLPPLQNPTMQASSPTLPPPFLLQNTGLPQPQWTTAVQPAVVVKAETPQK